MATIAKRVARTAESPSADIGLRSCRAGDPRGLPVAMAASFPQGGDEGLARRLRQTVERTGLLRRVRRPVRTIHVRAQSSVIAADAASWGPCPGPGAVGAAGPVAIPIVAEAGLAAAVPVAFLIGAVRPVGGRTGAAGPALAPDRDRRSSR